MTGAGERWLRTGPTAHLVTGDLRTRIEDQRAATLAWSRLSDVPGIREPVQEEVAMANISKRENGSWRARYRDDAGKEHAKHFARKSDAQRWINEVTASVVRGDYVDPKAGRVTVAAYAATWEAVQVSSPGTARIVDNALRLHLLPELGA